LHQSTMWVVPLLVTALAMIRNTDSSAKTVPGPKAPRTKPLWMVYTRHPAKGSGNDAAITMKGELPKNGALQVREIMNNAGTNLQRIFSGFGAPTYLDYVPEAKSMFLKMKELFEGSSTVFGWETSDLRRAAIESIALRSSLEHAFPGTTLKGTPFKQFHALGEKYTLTTPFNKRSWSRLLDDGGFTDERGHVWPKIRNKNKYWDYMFVHGMPDDKADTKGKEAAAEVRQKLRDYVIGSGEDALSTKIEWPDFDSTQWPNVAEYMGERTSDGTLSLKFIDDWEKGVDLLIIVGHGTWYKHMLRYCTDPALRKKLETPRKGSMSKAPEKDPLDYTEFVLLKWEKHSGRSTGNLAPFRITAGFKPPTGAQWYQLEKYLPAAAGAGNSDFGDYAEYDYGDDYYGNDYYDDDYYYGDEYGQEDYEYALYEEAVDNLVRARKQLVMAQRLLSWDRKLKNRGNHFTN